MGTTLYDESFFADVEITARASALRVVPAAVRRWRPRHVVDVGCGQGVWASAFEAMGVPTLAIDGEHVPPDQVLTPRFLAWDLARPLPELGRFDLCVCLEVAEHLPAAAAGSFVATLTELSDRVLFSAAVPGQGGTGHVNEQPHDYWIERFTDQGYDADTTWRDRFAGDEDVAWWYRQNVIVFGRREPRPEGGPPSLPQPAGAPAGPASTVELVAARRAQLRHHLDLATGLANGRAQRTLARVVDRLARPILRRHTATTHELLAAVEAIDACLGEVAAELQRLDRRTDSQIRSRLASLEYAVRRIHGPLLVEAEADPD